MDHPPKGDIENATELEEALTLAGFGCYSLKCILTLTLLLLAALLEPISLAYVLPAAKCDFNITHHLQGFLTSIPYIGFVIAAFPWGYTIDTQGRKVVAVYGSIGTGAFAALAAFMPDVISFVVCKFLSSLCLAATASVPYTYVSELVPQKQRDFTVVVINCIQIFGTGVEPLIAWPVLSSTFKINFGLYYFRPWRLLIFINAMPFFMAAVLLYFGPESPKFLVAQRRHDEALDVLQKMYAGNNTKSPEDYPVKILKLPLEREKKPFLRSLYEQCVQLVMPPFGKWLLLCGSLCIGCFCTSTGLYMWVPEILNQALSAKNATVKLTSCQAIMLSRSKKLSAQAAKCVDKLEQSIFIINIVASTICAGIAFCVSFTVKYIGKTNLMIIIFFFVGCELFCAQIVTNGVLFGVMLSTITLTALCIGSINAHAIEIFPTHLRGMAVSLSMIMARLGAVVGVNATAHLLVYSCEAFFYIYGSILICLGRYNLKCILTLTLLLFAAILDPVGNAYVLPAAKCDLEMEYYLRGFLASIPYIGFIITAFPWGYITDTKGRKVVAVYGSLGCGVFGVLAAFMPDVISFVIFKFLSALCFAGPASVPYTYISELVPQKQRDVTLVVVNSIQILGAGMVPLVAWPILQSTFNINFGLYNFRTWRLLVFVNSMPFVLVTFLVYRGPESPKFLVAQGRHDEALHVLQKIYAGNNRKSPEDYPIKKLKIPPERAKTTLLRSLHNQSVPLLKPPYVKWLLLTGILFVGCFSTLNGLYLWIPDILNQAFSAENATSAMTACQVIIMNRNMTTAQVGKCVDKIEQRIFIINSIASTACASIAFCISFTVKYIGKKRLISIIFFYAGLQLFIVNLVTNGILFAVMLTSINLTALCIGPINAHAIEIFPTHLRGMAIGLAMLMARMGSVVGANVTGLLLYDSCVATFYVYGTLLVSCGFLAFLLPRQKVITPPTT